MEAIVVSKNVDVGSTDGLHSVNTRKRGDLVEFTEVLTKLLKSLLILLRLFDVNGGGGVVLRFNLVCE